MERLTIIDYEDMFLNKCVQSLMEGDAYIIDEIYQKLGNYEDTGLEPSEVVKLQKENEKLKQQLFVE